MTLQFPSKRNDLFFSPDTSIHRGLLITSQQLPMQQQVKRWDRLRVRGHGPYCTDDSGAALLRTQGSFWEVDHAPPMILWHSIITNFRLPPEFQQLSV